MRSNFHLSLLAVAIASSFAAPVLADDEQTLDTVTVTAHRSKVKANQALAAVTVIERVDIEASQAPDLIDLLSRQAGIDVSRNGGPGQASTVFMRGSNANHSLVLIDGLRVNSASQGVFDFAHLPLSRIERIEIVRGPRAALWGSDAIGGVIHIFTRDPSKPSAELRGGSDGRFGADASFGSGDADHGFGIGLGGERLRGFSATNDHAWGHDPDNDGYHNRSVNLQARTLLGSQRVSFSGLATDADVEFDDGETSARNADAGVVIAGNLGTDWAHSLSLGHARESLRTPAYDNAVDSRRNSLDWLLSRNLGDIGQLQLGLNGQRESTLSLSDFSGVVFDRSRSNRAGFVALQGWQQTLDYELALRHDHSSQYGSARTGQAALGWQAGTDLRLRASWGEGFRVPNFNELYHPGFGGWYAGDPGLQPERSRTSEVGLEWTASADHHVTMSIYRSDVRQLITFSGPQARAQNIARAELEGIELGHRWQSGGFRLTNQASWQRAINADTGNDLLRRAKRKISVSADYRFEGGWSLGLDSLGIAAREDFAGRLPGFARFDLRLSLPLGDAWQLDVRVENLADRFYQWADGYNTPDRSGLLTLRWQPGK